MPGRVAKFKKNTRRNGRKASRKMAGRGRSRRQRGGSSGASGSASGSASGRASGAARANSIVVYGLMDKSFTINQMSSPTPGVTATGGSAQCTLNFNPAITIKDVTFSSYNGSKWLPEKPWNKSASGTGAPVLKTPTKLLVAAAPLGTQSLINKEPVSSLTITTFSLVNLGSLGFDITKKDKTVNGLDGANLRITITTA